MNDAVYKFKRYEDASLVYVGIDKHEGEDVGLYDTVLSAKEYSAEVENVAALHKERDYSGDEVTTSLFSLAPPQVFLLCRWARRSGSKSFNVRTLKKCLPTNHQCSKASLLYQPRNRLAGHFPNLCSFRL
jgi:hypothetical protein